MEQQKARDDVGFVGSRLPVHNVDSTHIEQNLPLVFGEISRIRVQVSSKIAAFWDHNLPFVTFPGSNERNSTLK